MILGITMFLLIVGCQPQIEEENHFHALAFDPTEAGGLYVATHHFLEKHQDQNIFKLGSDDYMGFVIAKDGTFYSSGHSPQIPNVGIRKSMDKGKTWQTLAYEGLDFHDMAVSYANPDIIYAWSTPPEELLVVSKNGGQGWEEIDTDFQQDLYALATDHQQENKLYAGSLLGLFVSEDYGKTWKEMEKVQNTTVLAIADDPITEGTMYLSTFSRGILRTVDGGDTWGEINEGLPASKENPLLFLMANPHDTREVFGFTRHNEIFKYDGERWNKIRGG